MKVFNKLPIGKKITLVNLLVAGLVLCAAGGMLFLLQQLNLKQNVARDLSAVAEIMASNSSAPLAFQDKESAQEILSALSAKPEVVQATIQLPSGAHFATYGEKDVKFPQKPGEGISVQQVSFQDGYCFLDWPIKLDGKAIGRLRVAADYHALSRSLMRLYASVLMGVLAASFLLAFLLSFIFQKSISNPILKLAQAAQAISEKKDYGIRATQTSEDELGTFVTVFNQMLDKIQEDDEALRSINRDLEKEIDVRRKIAEKLRISEERFQYAVRGSNDGIWDWNNQTGEVYYSGRLKELLGYKEEEFDNTFGALENRLHPDDREEFLLAIRNHLELRAAFDVECRVMNKAGQCLWIRCRGQAIWNESGEATRMAGSISDITQRKETESKLEDLHNQLVESSRQAGMAEVATGVLHNVGNVLNSINVSATVVMEGVEKSKVVLMDKVASLLTEHRGDLGSFIDHDPKGKQLPGFLEKLAQNLLEDRTRQLGELKGLRDNLEHVKSIIHMQQEYAKVSGLSEILSIRDLVEDAIKINEGSLARHDIQVIKEFEEVPLLQVDKHKIMQILINLIRNAKHAINHNPGITKRLVISITRPIAERVEIAVKDNGVGIAPGNESKVFQHGFTTKKDGHGFGLHSGALAAKQMGGGLSVHSEGLNQGATFTLELPVVENSPPQSGVVVVPGPGADSSPNDAPSENVA